jgi:hypothetical protein
VVIEKYRVNRLLLRFGAVGRDLVPLRLGVIPALSEPKIPRWSHRMVPSGPNVGNVEYFRARAQYRVSWDVHQERAGSMCASTCVWSANVA